MMMNCSDPGLGARHGARLPVLAAISLVVCLFAASEPATAADPLMSPSLGRLFMSPDERRALDAGKTAHAGPDGPSAVVGGTGPARVVLNGILKRSDGPDVVWINGQPAGSKDAPLQVRRGPDGQNTVTLLDTADGRSVKLKPGQSWTP
jgi:hypothetical protein